MLDDALRTDSNKANEPIPEWTEEQQRYRVLLTVYARTGARCEEEVSGTAIGTELGLRFEDLYRIIHFLEYNGYLDYRGAGPRVCITRAGIDYIRQVARRRRSIRSPETRLRPYPVGEAASPHTGFAGRHKNTRFEPSR